MRFLLSAAWCLTLGASGWAQSPAPAGPEAPGAGSRAPPGIVPTQPAPTRVEDWPKLVPPEGLSQQEYAKRARQTLEKLLAMKLHWSEVPVRADPTGTIHHMVMYPGPGNVPPDAGLYPNGSLQWLRAPSDRSAIPSDARFYMQWYPSGRPMVVETHGSERLVLGRYYGPAGEVPAKVDDGTGTRLIMSVAPRHVGAVRIREELLNGLVHGVRTTWFLDDGPREEKVRFRQGVPIGEDPPPRAETPVHYFKPSHLYPWQHSLAGYSCGGVAYFSEEELKAAAEKHPDMPPAIAAAIVKHPELEAPYRKFATEKDFTPGGVAVSKSGLALVWGTFRTETPGKGIPNAVHVSRDGGRSWTRVTVPADYVHRVGFCADGAICAEAHLLPPGGLGDVPHQAFLPLFTFVSADGKDWIRCTGYYYHHIVKQEPLPGGRGTIVRVQPPVYKAPIATDIYLVRDLKEPPILLGRDGYSSRTSVTWSKDGGTITVRSNASEFNFVLDVEKNQRTPLPVDATPPSP